MELTRPYGQSHAQSPKRLRVEITHGPDAGLVVESQVPGPVSVGTSPDNDFVLTDKTVSRYHLELAIDAHGVRVRDLGSLNAILTAGVRITDAVVPIGTTLVLGSTRLTVFDAAPAVMPPNDIVQISGFVGVSDAMQRTLRRALSFANSDANVLIQGETGTGKELLARAIHEHSGRANAPFVIVDCGALAPTLIGSELFGHERGAFTGAARQRKGAFERAHGGTVFLDEIGELPQQIQPALLGVIERGAFRRLGGDKRIDVDVRVVSATHRDLRSSANDGSFRADLYYRLAVARVHAPPLRDRPDDIEALVAHFTHELVGKTATDTFDFSAMAALRTHHWAGNVRELRNVVESALALGALELDGMSAARLSSSTATFEPGVTYRAAKLAATSAFELSFLEGLMAAAGGNISEAARRARMDRPYLSKLLKKHGLR